MLIDEEGDEEGRKPLVRSAREKVRRSPGHSSAHKGSVRESSLSSFEGKSSSELQEAITTMVGPSAQPMEGLE